MNTREIAEIKRHIRRDRSNMTAIYGCYVNEKKEIISQFRQSTAMMSENEGEKYFSLLKKSLSGSLGKNLLDICFKTSQVADSPEHKLLMTLRTSKLSDTEALQLFYQKIIAAVSLEESYLILLGCDTYDVPFKNKEGFTENGDSDESFTFLLCAVCPVKQTKGNLHYHPESKEFHDGGVTNICAAPEIGFLFPAFDNRSTNIYQALYYTHSPKNNHKEFVHALFKTPIPKPAYEQKKSFEALLGNSLKEDCNLELMQNVHQELCQRIDMHKESRVPEALLISKKEVQQVLMENGVAESHLAKFSIDYDEAFGFEGDIHPKNIIDNKRFQLTTPDVTVQVAPDRTDLIETRNIGGVHYIMIRAEGAVQVNGVTIHFDQDQESPL